MTGNCARCGKPHHRIIRTWCAPCYERWRYHGQPEPGPPYTGRRGWRTVKRRNRMEDYAWLLENDPRITDREAARRIVVHHRTIQRYRAELGLAS